MSHRRSDGHRTPCAASSRTQRTVPKPDPPSSIRISRTVRPGVARVARTPDPRPKPRERNPKRQTRYAPRQTDVGLGDPIVTEPREFDAHRAEARRTANPERRRHDSPIDCVQSDDFQPSCQPTGIHPQRVRVDDRRKRMRHAESNTARHDRPAEASKPNGIHPPKRETPNPTTTPKRRH